MPRSALIPASAMLPMSQPTALNAREIPPAAPGALVTVLPAEVELSISVAFSASTTILPSSPALIVLDSTIASTAPVSWVQAIVPPNDSENVAEASSASPTTARDSVTALIAPSLEAITAKSPASTSASETCASTPRSTVALATATPI